VEVSPAHPARETAAACADVVQTRASGRCVRAHTGCGLLRRSRVARLSTH
jgi:hypothetical protein